LKFFVTPYAKRKEKNGKIKISKKNPSLNLNKVFGKIRQFFYVKKLKKKKNLVVIFYNRR
jgi:hypothetical protein